jgi:ribosomal protein S18 acetylase RimI-like enzyme
MNIRPVRIEDVTELAPVMAELGYPTDVDSLASRVAIIVGRPDFATFVAEANGVVAGMITVTLAPSIYRDGLQGAIVALVVSASHRGRGLAGRLVEKGERWLVDNGALRATVNPSNHRIDAHALYRRLGYDATGTRFTKLLAVDSTEN